jgi:acyl-CoA thioester hydrolase
MKKYGDYSHGIPIQIRFSDVDLLGHVNNACYHSFVELARVAYFNGALKDHINWQRQGFILARTEMDHLEPAFLDDELHCFTKVKDIGNKSLTIQNAIVKLKDGEPLECASCTGILVAMDYANNVSIRVPDLWRKLFREFGEPR